MEYSVDIATRFCELIASGLTPRTVCRMDGMPDRMSLYRWRVEHPDFDEAVRDALKLLADELVSQATVIVDEDPDPQRAHNRADTRRWLAAALHPDQYAPRQKVDVTVDHRVDLGDQLRAARERAGIGSAEPGRIIDAEVIEERTLDTLPASDKDGHE